MSRACTGCHLDGVPVTLGSDGCNCCGRMPNGGQRLFTPEPPPNMTYDQVLEAVAKTPPPDPYALGIEAMRAAAKAEIRGTGKALSGVAVDRVAARLLSNRQSLRSFLTAEPAPAGEYKLEAAPAEPECPNCGVMISDAHRTRPTCWACGHPAPADGVCTTPNGRTGCHGDFVRMGEPRDEAGFLTLYCSFCGKPA